MHADRSLGHHDLALLSIADEEVCCDLDSRLEYSQLTLEDDAGETSAILPLVRVSKVTTFNAPYRQLTGLDQADGPLLAVGGGLAQFRDAIWTRSSDPARRTDEIRTLVEQALKLARDHGDTPITTFIADQSLAALDGSKQSATALDQWCTFDLGGARSLEDLLGSLGRRARQTWRRDLRDAERLGLTHRVVDLSDDTIREVAPAVAAVSRRNGLVEAPAMAAHRMKSYRRRAGAHFVLQTVDHGGALAYTVCRTWGTYLEAHTMGILESVEPDRREVYHFAAYLAPLLAAVKGGHQHIGYGYSHVLPKLARGCRADQMWRVDLAGQR